MQRLSISAIVLLSTALVALMPAPSGAVPPPTIGAGMLVSPDDLSLTDTSTWY
jgi:hypothetical protein